MISLKEVIGIHEVRTLRFLKSIIAELLGTCFLVIVGCGSASTLSSDRSPDSFPVAFTFGLAVATSVWLFGHTSGAHINPSITIGFLVTGHISILKCICYIAAQVAGALAGAALLWLILPEYWRGTLGAPALGKDVADWQGVLIEMIGTFLLVMTVFASCDRLRTDHSGSIALAIGFCVAAQITWMGNVTGGGINPARSLGPTVFAGAWKNHWVYWTGPIVGGILAALLYERVFAERTPETEKEIRHAQYNNCNIQSNSFLDYVIEIEPPTETKPTSKPSIFKNGTKILGDIISLEENVEKEQIFLKSFIALDSIKLDQSNEENCIRCENETGEEIEEEEADDTIADDTITEDTSNL